MSLWDWAVRVHGAPDVDRLCLELQDIDSQCVSFLLWAAWAARRGSAINPAALDAAAAVARAWDERAMTPLRAARRGMKPAAPGLDDAQRLALRGQVQAIELAAERLLLEALERQTPAEARAPRDVLSALAEAAQAWNGAAPDRLKALADAFSRA